MGTVDEIAGLALFSPLMGSVVAMLKEARDIESALITFLVTASGVTVPLWLPVGGSQWVSFGNLGAAFLGLVAGLLLFGARHLMVPRK